jgi:hypothetical protein
MATRNVTVHVSFAVCPGIRLMFIFSDYLSSLAQPLLLNTCERVRLFPSVMDRA